jgi:hypothetical protein
MKKKLTIIAIIIIASLFFVMLVACSTKENKLINATVNDFTRAEYYKGDSFSTESLHFAMEYVKNEKQVTIPDYTYANAVEDGLEISVTGFDSSIESDKVTLTIIIKGGLKFKGTLKTEFNIKIRAIVIDRKFVINTENRKIEYTVGEEFSSVGLSVKQYYSDGTEDIIPLPTSSVSNFDTTKAVACKFMLISIEFADSKELEYAVTPGEDYVKYGYTVFQGIGAVVRFYYKTEYRVATTSGLRSFESESHGNFNISGNNATDYDEFSQTEFVTNMSDTGLNISVSGFEKTKLNDLNVAIIDYGFTYYTVNIKQRALWIFGSTYTIIFTFTFPVDASLTDINTTNAIFNTIIGSVVI